ncbi:peptide cleavage/export ABC transporter [Lactobacillus johnsonii]|uniref:peptide cleavage/export ABC transporter n=1 Tax=Lactobacillus johnsonii TaxID=33959 RepID=UPI000A3ACDA0|nr:peptide cleavage/export ABC transporter [Lactobacillus johnsonii]AYN49194.1 Lactococcin-G-processing and transport ATP-binding protein LagD [Lactobacillus johnsonii]OUL54513.1 peptide ABC transporter ATP-binding protein [Lactobacillus johnsonii]
MLFKYKSVYVPQVDEMDCGVACLAMILKQYQSRVSLAHLRHEARTNLEGTTALGLVKTAQKFNFKTEAVKADMSLFNEDTIQYPFIVHVLKQGELLHYYVVLKNTKNYLVIADPDPSVGIIKMPKDKFAQEWTGIALFMVPNEDFEPIKEKKNNLWSLFPYMFKQKRLMINIILAALLMTIISICSSYFVQGIIDTYIPDGTYQTLSILAVGLLIAYIFNSIFSYGQNFLLNVLGQRLSIDLNLQYIRHIFELPMEFFVTRRTGEITSRFSDASRIIDALASTVISLFLDLAIVIVMGLVLAAQNTTLFGITLLALPVYAIVILGFTKKFEKLNDEQMESNAVLSSSVIEDIQGIETIKALNSEDTRYRRIDSQFVNYLKKSFKYSKTESLQTALKTFIQLSLNVIILWVGARVVMQGEMSIGQLMTFNALLSYFIDPLQNIINLQPRLQSASVAQNRLNEVYQVQSEFNADTSIQNSAALEGMIEYKHVDYRYGYGTDVLKDINLKIKPDEKLAIVGMSGSGKSTMMVKLLVDFFSPSKGEVTLNGHATSEVNKHTLRSYVNYVPQTPYIFSGTVKENLLLGCRADISEEEVIKACQIAGIDQEIANLPLQFETKLDENAKILSGGQKQRLTIARALLSPAKVFIFDEVTSGLDTITEKRVVDNLMKLKDKTIIFIAHRLAIAERADKVVVIDKGQIVEEGSHEELMEQHGFYYDLVKG